MICPKCHARKRIAEDMNNPELTVAQAAQLCWGDVDCFLRVTANGYAALVETTREERDAAKEENTKLKALMTKQYQDDERAHRVLDKAGEILAKVLGVDSDEFLGAMADLTKVHQGDEPCTPWEDVKAEIDAYEALADLKKEFAEERATFEREAEGLRGKITELRDECRRLLGEAADAKWDLDP